MDSAELLDSFQEAARPLIKWMAENVHPEHTAIVQQDRAQLCENKQRVIVPEYVQS